MQLRITFGQCLTALKLQLICWQPHLTIQSVIGTNYHLLMPDIQLR